MALNTTEHLYACVGEEGTEIGQICAKILRFGANDIYNSQEKNPERLNNRERLIGEVNDLLGVMKFLVLMHEIPNNWEDVNAQHRKIQKVRKYMDYAVQAGQLK